MRHRLHKSYRELENIAEVLLDELKQRGNSNCVSRYNNVSIHNSQFCSGKELKELKNISSINLEHMQELVYCYAIIDEFKKDIFQELAVARDNYPINFSLPRKGLELPSEKGIFYEEIPDEISYYDHELREISRHHNDVKLTRSFAIEQKVIVNSNGGVAIQSIPIFGIYYDQGYDPLHSSRELSVVCNTNEDIKNMTKLIKYLPDPYPDERIRKSRSFFQAFEELYNISGLKYGDFEEAGIKIQELYDVISLSGTPVHEVFGHQFEEPIRHLLPGECATFKIGQNIKNKDLELKDDPSIKIEGFRVDGFSYFDSYGRKREPRVHIKNGEIIGFLGSEYGDVERLKKYRGGINGETFYGNAIQNSTDFSKNRMSCTFLEGKIENIDLEGKILLIGDGGHTNPYEKTYFVKSSESYIIRNGIPERIVPIQVTGAINSALKHLLLLGPRSYCTGTCSVAHPLFPKEQRSEVQCSQLTRNQMWRQQQVYPLNISDKEIGKLIKR